MKDENMTREQLLDELSKLRQENIQLKLAQDQTRNSSVLKWSSPSLGLSNGRHECDADKHEQPHLVNHPMKYKFSDLVDVSLLRQLFNSCYKATGIPHAILDIDNNILSRIGWQDICTKFHRTYPQTECLCKQSDSYITSHLHDGPYVGYHCMNGLMDYAIPIIVEGQHLATIFHGQFLHEPPDEEYFRRQAQEYGFDEEAYMEALRKVPVIPEEQIEPVMVFYSQIGQIFASMGLERKRQLGAAEQVIREREERLKLIWETSNDGFWDWNIETDELHLSPRWAEIIGYALEELDPHFGMWEKLLHPDDKIAVLKVLNENLQGLTAEFKAEYRILTKSGEWKWVSDRGQVVAKNAKGHPLRMVGTMFDLTVRKQAEVALLKSEEKFSKAFHCSPDIMTISTLKEGRYLEVNKTFVESTGYERQEALGHTVYELGIWVDPEERNQMLEQIQENATIRDFEQQLGGKSGQIRTYSLSGEIIDLDDEAHLIMTARDITERKQMEEALRFSEECFSKAFNASPVLMALTKLEDGECIKTNNAFCRILGYSREEAIGLKSTYIGFWADPADRELVKQRILAKQSVQDMEIYFCKKSGERRLGLYSAEGLDVHGELCILSMLTDITELRKMEAEMTRLDRLNLVGEMAASIGHEIRNPMTTVRGYLQIMRENKDYSKEIDYFDLMIEEMDRANSIITEFLSLAKNKIVNLKPGNLNSIIRKLIPLIHAKALSKDQNIKLELEDLSYLLLDEKEISQLIHNMVNNALESMPSTGEVTVKTYMENNKVVLAIQDQGHGIDCELVDKLGTPFLTTKEQGTGLGLAVCYRIATRHNAKIDFDTDSTGTTFYVKFPSPIADITNSTKHKIKSN